MFHRLWLIPLISILAVGIMSRVSTAQEAVRQPQDRYIAELKQRNAAYGPGCNGIGITVPVAVDMPADITSRWAAGHSACIPDVRLVMSCAGEVVGEERVIGCLLHVADGQTDRTITCEQLTLITPGARYTPDPALSVAMAEASEGGSQGCAEPRTLAPGVTLAVPFHIPAATSTGALAVMIDIDGAEVPAFLIPVGQLNIEPPSGS